MEWKKKKKGFSMPSHRLTNLGMQIYFQNKPKLSTKWSQKTAKDVAYTENLDEYKSTGTHMIALYMNSFDSVTYFDSFGLEYIPEELLAATTS